MPSDSSTGGFLLGTSPELNDEGLQQFLQQLVVGLAGIPGTLVFPRWQAEPPNLPDFGKSWASIGRGRRTRDVFATSWHQGHPDPGFDLVHRTEILEVLCSFYGPQAEQNAENLAVGFMVAQNREGITQAGYGLVEVGEALTLPDKLHERWTYRVDLAFRLRRAQLYTYPVLNLTGATGNIIDDSGAVKEPLQVTSQPPSAPLPLFAWGLAEGIYAGWGSGNWR